MSFFLYEAFKVTGLRLLSSLLMLTFALASVAQAHEVLPSIANFERDGDQLEFDVRMNLETVLAGIDQAEVADTNDAPQAEEYDTLRALDNDALAARFEQFWPDMAAQIDVLSGDERLPLTLQAVEVEDEPNFELPRTSFVRFSADLPAETENITLSWAREYGALVLVQNGVDAPFDGYLEAGTTSPVIMLAGGNQAGPFASFINYIPVGFDHIIPKGLDHILFVLGLFFLSTRMKPLLWQVTAFTLAHTITLALAALGYVSVPGSIVEPLIALSIVYVAVENIYTDGLSPWRPFVIFGFGLLHGLGFASVLAEFGLPDQSFVPALIGFNVGVEVGQLAVIAVAFACTLAAVRNSQAGDANKPLSVIYLVAMLLVIVCLIPLSGLASYGDLVPLVAALAILLGLCAVSCSLPRFEGYREIVAMPGSVLIAVVAAYWCVERVFL